MSEMINPRGRQYVPLLAHSTPEIHHENTRNPAFKRGAELQEEIRTADMPFGQAAIWWLGQGTFCFKLGQQIIYTDPFYRAADQEPPTNQELPLKPHEFTNASFILGTHEHLDHIDPYTFPGAAAASPLAHLVIPNWTSDFVRGMNVPADRLITMRGDDKIERDGITIHAIPAAHMRLEYNDHAGFRFLGYVIKGNGIIIYQTGDTQPYHGWYERVSKFELDIALLPISGHDNLHWPQALYFCALHRPKLAIPMHYGTFAWTEDPMKLAEGLSYNVPEQKIKVLQVGEKFIYNA